MHYVVNEEGEDLRLRWGSINVMYDTAFRGGIKLKRNDVMARSKFLKWSQHLGL